jgi:putative phosphoesterase
MPTIIRIGVVSDTHCPEFAGHLPPALFEAFRGVDLILHAGDVTGAETLEQLAAIAPVLAVQGNHDQQLALPSKRIVDCGAIRIGMVHGHRGRIREFPGVAWNEAFAGRAFTWNGARGHVLRQFEGEDVDAVVFGHFHRPCIEWRSGASGRPLLLFSPGATYFCVAEEARRRLAQGGPLHHRLYYLSRSRWRQQPATAGLLTITDGKLHPELITLPSSTVGLQYPGHHPAIQTTD